MNRIILFLLFFVHWPLAAQQFPFEFWYEGKLVLESSDTLKGLIKYDMNDLLQIRIGKRMESYSARKLVFFEIYDAKSRIYRQFYSLPYSENEGYKYPKLFELVSEGKITVLSREKLEYKTYNSPYYSPYYYSPYNNTYSNSRMVLTYEYFLLKENGSIIRFSGKKSDWFDLMHDREDEVKDYMHQNKLNFDTKFQVSLIVNYYNSFSHPK